MSIAARMQIARRSVLKGMLGAAAVAIAALAVVEAPRFFTRHVPSAYDDLLAQLPDRDNAVRIGAAFLAGARNFDAGRVARSLRARLAGRSLASAMDADLARARLVEAHGWVLPETLANLCALAAKAE
jgi:hypothetical protein